MIFTAADEPYVVPNMEEGVITKIPKKRGRRRSKSTHNFKFSNKLKNNRKSSGKMDQEGENSDEALSIPEDNRSLKDRNNDSSSLKRSPQQLDSKQNSGNKPLKKVIANDPNDAVAAFRARIAAANAA